MPAKKERDGKEDEIRKLKEKIKELEAAKREGKEEEVEGITEGILKGVAGMLPGLEGLLKGIMKSPAFKEKLGQIEKEIEHKMKQAPLKRTETGISGVPGGVPSGVRAGRLGKKHFIRKRAGGMGPRATSPVPKERPADVFDEKDHIEVIAEIPGLKEKDIKIDLERDSLTISVDIPGRKYHQELKLPCSPEGKLEKTYKNGILEIKLMKQ